jgi:hypothetical protein
MFPLADARRAPISRSASEVRKVWYARGRIDELEELREPLIMIPYTKKTAFVFCTGNKNIPRKKNCRRYLYSAPQNKMELPKAKVQT